MKKLLAVLVCLALVCAMGGVVGCDGKTKTPSPTKTDTTTTPATTTPAKTT